MINFKNIIKSMLILFSFMLMTGIIMLYIDEKTCKSVKKPDEEIKRKIYTLENDVYGLDDAINIYYNVNLI